jgi:CheY-like chemotaxis protein
MFSNAPRILLIDDNRHGLPARRCALQEAGYEVETAGGGDAGLKKFFDGQFDAVVTDYRMPEVNGSEVLRVVREHNGRIPVVILSGQTKQLGLTEQSTGADAVLAKGPAEERDLIRAIDRLVRKSSGRSRHLATPLRAQAAAAGGKK